MDPLALPIATLAIFLMLGVLLIPVVRDEWRKRRER